MTDIVRTLSLGFADLAANRYPTVDFEVPSGTESVEVHLDYDRDVATIDLGCEGAGGWRGWSGGARSWFMVSNRAATPGYLPGDLEPGLWRVQLGLYRLPADPIDVTVTIRTPAVTPLPPEPEVTPRPDTPRASVRNLPSLPGLTWYAGDFHAHSTHSDGEQSLPELAALAVEAGLDFLAVTEHNTTSHHPLLADLGTAHDITLLPGQEVTTPRGHANAFGDIGWIDFRRHPDHWVREVAERGGILSINHPLQDDCAWQHELSVLPAALELWHISWFLQPDATGPWAYLARWDREAILLGGSDYHRAGQGYKPGTPVTWVAAENRSADAILDGVRQGRTMITRLATPDAPALVRLDDDLVALSADGTVLTDFAGRRRVLHGDRVVIPVAEAGEAPYRLESVAGLVLAITR